MLMITEKKQSELHANYRIFAKILPDLLPKYEGKFALMRHGAFIAYFDNPGEALSLGRAQYDDELFSVQEVPVGKADFGWYSRAPGNTPL
jgi:hypothetical protein